MKRGAMPCRPARQGSPGPAPDPAVSAFERPNRLCHHGTPSSRKAAPGAPLGAFFQRFGADGCGVPGCERATHYPVLGRFSLRRGCRGHTPFGDSPRALPVGNRRGLRIAARWANRHVTGGPAVRHDCIDGLCALLCSRVDWRERHAGRGREAPLSPPPQLTANCETTRTPTRNPRLIRFVRQRKMDVSVSQSQRNSRKQELTVLPIPQFSNCFAGCNYAVDRPGDSSSMIGLQPRHLRIHDPERMFIESIGSYSTTQINMRSQIPWQDILVTARSLHTYRRVSRQPGRIESGVPQLARVSRGLFSRWRTGRGTEQRPGERRHGRCLSLGRWADALAGSVLCAWN